MKYKIGDILEIDKISSLLESYTEATGLVSALLDLEGNILSKSGWKEICTEFHRKNPETAQNCRKSDTALASKLKLGGKFNVYKCLNGLVDVAVPLIVDGEHIANLFTGQFLLAPPDEKFFNEQANRYNFDRIEYMKALSEVPVIEEDDIKSRLNFLLKMTEVIAEIGIARIKQIETNEALERSEKKYSSLFRNLNEGFALHEIITDNTGKPIDYKYLEVNSAFGEITGIDPQYVVGKTIREVFPGIENDPANGIEKYGKVAATGEELTFEEYFLYAKRWFLIHAFSTKQGQFAVTFNDITERKKSELNLQNSEKKFRALVEQSLTGIYIFEQKKFLYANNRFAEIFGYTVEEILQHLKPTDVVFDEDKTRAKENISKRLSGEVDSVHYFAQGIRKDKSRIWIEIHGTHINLDGKDVITGTVLDVTERINAEDELKKSNDDLFESSERYKALISSSNTGAWEYYSETNHLWCSDEYFSMLGLKISDFDISGKPNLNETWTELLHPKDRDKAKKAFAHYLKNPKGLYENNFRMKHKNGGWVWIWSRGQIILDENGKWTGRTVGTHINISKQKKYERELTKHRNSLEKMVNKRTLELNEKTEKLEKSQKALSLLLDDVNEVGKELRESNKKLLQANQELEAFSYSVSHDLRAPLRAIDGYSKIILEDFNDTLNDEAKRLFSVIIANTDKMHQLIEDILALSHLGRKELSRSEISLGKLLIKLIDEFKEENKDRNIKWEISKLPNIYGDYGMINQLFINLIANAIKFSGKKSESVITIGSETSGDKQVFFVSDNGVGFDMKYADKLFKVFQRLHTNEEFEGTGIGLAIVKRIVLKHNGSIWAESKINRGTTISFTLNLEASNYE